LIATLLLYLGEEKQRVALARALVTDPRILLLDEPLSALDSRTQESARELLLALHKNKKLTVLHITHDQTEARIMADIIAIVMDGKLMQLGVPEEIFGKPADSRVASFVEFENILKVKLSLLITAFSGLKQIAHLLKLQVTFRWENRYISFSGLKT
jgi:molybdate/tungstate transport system ATP-binding protein